MVNAWKSSFPWGLLGIAFLLTGCAPSLAGDYGIAISETAQNSGPLELRVGRDTLSVPVTHDMSARIIRDRLARELVKSGYNVDCYTEALSTSIRTDSTGRVVPPPIEYRFELRELTESPRFTAIPSGLGVGLIGPRDSEGMPSFLEERVVDWIQSVNAYEKSSIEVLSTTSFFVTDAGPLVDSLRSENKSLGVGEVSSVNVDCYNAYVHFEHGDVEEMRFEMDWSGQWRASQIKLNF